ncbi:MAG TPA: thioesterase family protein [Burkholderiaceae bacterium]|nr:thioesterase family protein [Burkholderiaceae bacterium]
MRFERSYPIRFAHCDFAGIVFYPQYLVLFNDHVEDWFNEALGQDFGAYHGELGLGIPVRLECDFLRPSRIGDSLTLWLEIERLGERSVTLARGARVGDEQRVALRQVLVCVELARQSSRPWPDSLRRAMLPYVAQPRHSNEEGNVKQ